MQQLQSEGPKQYHDDGRFLEGNHYLSDTGTQTRLGSLDPKGSEEATELQDLLEGASLQAGTGGTSGGPMWTGVQGKTAFPGARGQVEKETRSPEITE